jgi:hypothetical protein
MSIIHFTDAMACAAPGLPFGPAMSSNVHAAIGALTGNTW